MMHLHAMLIAIGIGNSLYTFLHLKRWRGIATRYAKNAASFLAAVQIRCLVLWLDIL